MNSKICTLGDCCVPEHFFDVKCEYPGAAEYQDIIKTDFELERRTVLNGGKCPPESLVKMLEDPQSFCRGLRISSSGHWICNDELRILMHFSEPGYLQDVKFSSTGEMQSFYLKMFERYKEISHFIYCCDKLESKEQIFRILDVLKRKWNPDAKLIVWSSLDDFKDGDVVNMKVQIFFKTGPAPAGFKAFEGSWQISDETLAKVQSTLFSDVMFETSRDAASWNRQLLCLLK